MLPTWKKTLSERKESSPATSRDIDDDERPKKGSRISIAATANGAACGVATPNNEHLFEEDSEDETAPPSAPAQVVDIPSTNDCVYDVAMHIQERLVDAATCPHGRTDSFWCNECNA